MIRHNLYEIDLEKKTAFCTACGTTKIYVTKSRTESVPKVFCLNRHRELRRVEKSRLDQKRRLKPDWKPRHSLSHIDIEKMTAICAVCGQTAIRKNTSKEYTNYRCVTKERRYGREYRRIHYTPTTSNSKAHTLYETDEQKKTAVCSQCGPVQIYIWQSKRKIGRRCSNATVQGVPPAQKIRREINTTLINEYKIEHGCQSCGYNKNPDRLYLHTRNRHKNDPKIEKLLKLSRDHLLQELGKSDVLCATCNVPVHKEFEIDRHGNEIPLQFSHL